MTVRQPLWSRNLVTLGSFFLVAAVTVALFVPTFSAHVAVLNTVSIDATPTSYAVAEDGEHLLVEIEVHNPTRSAFTAEYGNLYGKIGDEQVTTLGLDVTETKIPPGETRTVPVRIGIEDGHRDEVTDAIESGRLAVTGQLQGTIQSEDVEVEVTEEGDDV